MPTLERRLGLLPIVAISISTMLGSGIFVLPGLAFAEVGASMWLAYLLAGVCVLPAALCKSELATAMPVSGGTYVYLDRAFGPLAGTTAGIGLWLALLLKSAFALVGFSAYLYALTDVIPLRPSALALLAGIMFLNVRGVKRVSQIQTVAVVIAIVGLLALCVTSLLQRLPAPGPPFGGDGHSLLHCTALVFVSYAGVTKVAAIAEEVRNPARNLPWGILLSLVTVIALYVCVTLVMVGVIPAEELAGNPRPVFDMALKIAGPTLAFIAGVIGIATMTSMANAGLLAASRFPFAMARDDLLPASLARLHTHHRTPVVAIACSTVVMAIAIVFLDIIVIAKLASAFVIILYASENLAVLVLRETDVKWYRPSYRTPLYPWTPLFGVVACLILLVVLGPLAIFAAIGSCVPGAVLFFLYGKRRTDRRGVVGQRRQRPLEPRSGLQEEDGAQAVQQQADAVVGLFGAERCPETLVELAGALVDGPIRTFHITELPEQTALDEYEDQPGVVSIQRRLRAMAKAEDLEHEFSTVVSRDVIRTVSDLTSSTSAGWLFIEWAGKRESAYTFGNPLGWLADHLPCNLATFYDAGVRYIRAILVHVAPGPHEALAISTAERLAIANEAELTFVRFVADGEPPERVESAERYLEQVRDLCEAGSGQLVVRGKNESRALADLSDSYDLLVTVGAGRAGLWQRIRGTGLDRLTTLAACSVLRLKSPHSATRDRVESTVRRIAPTSQGLRGFLMPACVQRGHSMTRKDAVFETAAGLFANALDGVSRQTILGALREREQTQNTSLGSGVAVPHATLPEVGRTSLGILVADKPLDYGAPDGQPVDIFFVTLGTPEGRQEHLVLLAAIARLCMRDGVLAELRAARGGDDLLRIVEQHDVSD